MRINIRITRTSNAFQLACSWGSLLQMNYINLKKRCDDNVPGNTFNDFTEDTGGKAPGTNNQIFDEV